MQSDTRVKQGDIATTNSELPVEMVTDNQVVVGYKSEIELSTQSLDEIIPVRPDFVDDEKDAEIRAWAKTIADATIANPSDIEITTQIYGLGGDAMDTNTIQTSLIEEKVGPVLEAIATESPVQRSMLELKSSFDLITSATVKQQEVDFETPVEKAKFIFKIFGTEIVNKVIRRLPAGDQEVMMLINSRRDSVKDMIDGIKRHLLEQKDIALRNAVELAKLTNQLEATQSDLQIAAYQGQLIWQMLNEARSTNNDPVWQQSMLYLINDLALLVVDIQGVDQLNIQSRLGG